MQVKDRHCLAWVVQEYADSLLGKFAAVRGWYYRMIPYHRGTGGTPVVNVQAHPSTGEVEYTHPGGGTVIESYRSSSGDQTANVLKRIQPPMYIFDSQDNIAMTITNENVFTDTVLIHLTDLVSVAGENMVGDAIMSAPDLGDNWYPSPGPTVYNSEAIIGIKNFGYDGGGAYIEVFVNQTKGSDVTNINWYFGATLWLPKPT